VVVAKFARALPYSFRHAALQLIVILIVLYHRSKDRAKTVTARRNAEIGRHGRKERWPETNVSNT
jgi:hypothetical protein